VSNNNDLDPAASTQMFRAFVDGGTPNAPTPAARESKSGNLGKVIGAVVVIAVIAIVAIIALH
jgi:hypothetical protein